MAVTAIALAACGGGRGIVPSQGTALSSSLAFAHKKTINPCAASTLPYYFKGSCTSMMVTAKGGGTKLAATGPRAVTMTFTLGKTNAKKKVAFIIGDAAAITDITPNGTSPAFPQYGKSPCVGGAKACFGKILVYAEIVNSGKTAIKVKGDSEIVVKAKRFPGPECAPAFLTAKGWDLIALAATVVKKHTATIDAPGGSLTLPAGPTYVAVSCAHG